MFAIGVDRCAKSERALVARRADDAEFGGAGVGCPSGDKGVRLDESGHRLAPDRGDRLYARNRPIAASTRRRTASCMRFIANCTTVSAASTRPIDLSRFMKGLIEIKYARHG